MRAILQTTVLLQVLLDSVRAAGRRFRHVRTGNARPQQAVPSATGGLGEALAVPGASASAGAILAVTCPVVAYPPGAADLCAAYRGSLACS